MKAAYIERTGPADVIQYGEVPTPEPIEGYVRVKVEAVAVNPIDTYVRKGMLGSELPYPFVVGCDLAGIVEKVGPGVTRFKEGDAVWGSNQGVAGRQGTFAEYACVSEDWLYPRPPEVDPQTAAAAALVSITAHLGLFLHAGLQPNELAFINGGSGAVGSVAVQMAKAAGARVMATAGSREKLDYLLSLGTDVALNYKLDDVRKKQIDYDANGIDVYWEAAREPNFEKIFPMMGRRGRVIVMAGRDAKPTFPVGAFYPKDLSVRGFTIFNASTEEQRAAAEQVNAWLVDGSLTPRIDRVMPLAEAAVAHKLQEESTVASSGGVFGKLVLVP